MQDIPPDPKNLILTRLSAISFIAACGCGIHTDEETRRCHTDRQEFPSRGACIYCGARGVKLTDEHVIPLSLGGFHILEGASCKECADITTKFERDVAREMWGDARNSYNAPSRRKKERKTHIVLTDHNSGRRVKVLYSEYPAAMVFYKMGRAGLLEGLPDTVDVSNAWQIVAISDREKEGVY